MSAAGRFQNLVLEDVEETSKELGRGSYGVVIEVIVSGTKCAAKKIHSMLIQHDVKGHMMEKFEQEILLHSDQRHPNIVQLMGVYYPPDSKRIPTLVMEYLPFALSNCLMKQELELKVKYPILHDVAKGLRYLHGKRPPIVHCDLTANNILLTSSYTAKISDLGVSRLADTFNKQQLLTTAPGTQCAMPPEALKSNPLYNHKLDVFSYGCLILHVLTNEFPLPSEQFIPKPGDSTGAFIQVSEWERRSKYIKMIPIENEFLPLAKKCLANKPQERPEMSELEPKIAGIPALRLHPPSVQHGKVLPSKQAARPPPTTPKPTPIDSFSALSPFSVPSSHSSSAAPFHASSLQTKVPHASTSSLYMNSKALLTRTDKSGYKPLSKADKIPRTEVGYRVTDGNIAAIDFGTSSVSLAYTTKGDDKVNTISLDTNQSKRIILNTILLNKEEERTRIKAFGENARQSFAKQKTDDDKNYVYFERIRMSLKGEQAITRETLVESFSGEKFYLVEVIAFILKYLKDLLIDHLSRTVRPLKTTDFDWVITVPAIWDARGKRMMREAAYLAGLLTECSSIDQFTAISGSPLPLPDEVNPDKLSLALEPESAAFYSQEMVGDQIKSNSSSAAIYHPTNYMVIDIGDGTVDIMTHIEVDGEIIVVPTSNACGHRQINEAFSQLLQKLVQDPGYEKFLASDNNRSKQKALVNSLLHEEFEGQKVLFGQCQTEEIAVNLFARIAEFYDKELQNIDTHGVEYEDDALYIDKEVVESQLFGPALDGIIKCTLEAIEENEYKVNTFYLAGGFGGCKYVHEKVTAAIGEAYNTKGRSCTVLVPPTPQLAVATGAVMWRKNPEKIKARRSDATYGIGTNVAFDAKKHDEHYKFYNEEENEYLCSDVYKVFLEKSELIKVDEVVFLPLIPMKQSQTRVCISIYSTPNLGVQYIKDKNGKTTVTEIGRLVIDIPNPDNLPVEQRIIDVTMDFSGTEIQTKAKYRVTGKEVKTVCDFLSTQ